MSGVSASPHPTIPVRKLVAVSHTETGAVATGTALIPHDDTIPQKTEGDEYMMLSHTPAAAGNKLVIEVSIVGAHTIDGSRFVVAVFKDTIASAIAAMSSSVVTQGKPLVVALLHERTAGSTSAQTFKVRIGTNLSGTFTFNGGDSARKLGGAYVSSIHIWEYEG